MNTPLKSKINWTAIVTLLVGIAVHMELVPQKLEAPLIAASLTLLPVLTIVFRTWFTEKK